MVKPCLERYVYLWVHQRHGATGESPAKGLWIGNGTYADLHLLGAGSDADGLLWQVSM